LGTVKKSELSFSEKEFIATDGLLRKAESVFPEGDDKTKKATESVGREVLRANKGRAPKWSSIIGGV